MKAPGPGWLGRGMPPTSGRSHAPYRDTGAVGLPECSDRQGAEASREPEGTLDANELHKHLPREGSPGLFWQLGV